MWIYEIHYIATFLHGETKSLPVSKIYLMLSQVVCIILDINTN